MKINKELWQKTCYLLKKEKIGKYKLKNLLNIPEKTAEFLINAYENKEIINLNLDNYELKNKESVIFFSDLHIPFENQNNLQLSINYVKDIKPDKIILGGDIIDFYKISKFTKNPKEKNILEEINLTKKFLKDLRNNFPDSEIIYLEGNHEQRITKFILDNAKELYEILENILQEKLRLDELNIKYQEGAFKIGKLWFLHGHEVNCKNNNVEYITNVVWKKVNDNFICGHWHRTQDKTWKNINNKYYGGYIVGCLCKDLEYAMINNWNNGFAIINFDNNGNYRIENKKIIEGEIF